MDCKIGDRVTVEYSDAPSHQGIIREINDDIISVECDCGNLVEVLSDQIRSRGKE